MFSKIHSLLLQFKQKELTVDVVSLNSHGILYSWNVAMKKNMITKENSIVTIILKFGY